MISNYRNLQTKANLPLEKGNEFSLEIHIIFDIINT